MSNFISDTHSPFNVVIVLRLENLPAPQVLEAALKTLQGLGVVVGSQAKFYPMRSIVEGGMDFHWVH